MGVKLLGVDISTLASGSGVAKRNFSSSFGNVGLDITVSPTPVWPNATAAAGISTQDTVSQQITGINTPITLSMGSKAGPGTGTFTVSVNSVTGYAGGTITTWSTGPTLFVVNPNYYVTFRYVNSAGGSVTFNVNNYTDSSLALDSNTTITVFSP